MRIRTIRVNSNARGEVRRPEVDDSKEEAEGACHEASSSTTRTSCMVRAESLSMKLVIQIPAWDEEEQIGAALAEAPSDVPGFAEIQAS